MTIPPTDDELFEQYMKANFPSHDTELVPAVPIAQADLTEDEFTTGYIAQNFPGHAMGAMPSASK